MHAPRLTGGRVAGLEGSTAVAGYATGGEVGVWWQGDAARTRIHSCPAWKLLACPGGVVEVEWSGGVVRSPAVLVPPAIRHQAAAGSRFVAVFVDVFAVAGRELPALPVAMGTDRAGEWAGAGRRLAGTGAGEALAATVQETLGMPRADRLAVVMRGVTATTLPSQVTDELGWSVGHLRDILRAEALPTLGQLLRWVRLRGAVASLTQQAPAVVAAQAGYSDQAHLTRVAAATLGRTPGSLQRSISTTAQAPPAASTSGCATHEG